MIPGENGRVELRESLVQMLAALQSERQALAGLDIDRILGCAADKGSLCATIARFSSDDLDEDCRTLVESAKRLNEVNQQVRNLIAANVSARLDALVEQGSGYARAARYRVNPVRLGPVMVHSRA